MLRKHQNGEFEELLSVADDDNGRSSTGWLLAAEEEENGGTSHKLDQIDSNNGRNYQIRKRNRSKAKHYHITSQRRKLGCCCILGSIMTIITLFLSIIFTILLGKCCSGGCPLKNVDEDEGGIESRIANLSAECPDFPWNKLRLPESLSPKLYELWIYPNLDRFKFKGNVRIYLNVTKRTNLVLLNSKNLKIEDDAKAELLNNGDKERQRVSLGLTEQKECALLEQLSWKTDKFLEEGNEIMFSVSFSGNITDNYAGLYRTTFRDLEGNVLKSVVTQFESTDARAMFPCLDEPGMKAKFKVSISSKEGHTTLANMPVKSWESHTVDGAQLKLNHFETTVTMSTYLLGIAVGDFVRITDETKNKTKVSVYAPKAQIEEGGFGLEVGTKGLEYLESFFDIPFPLPKQDLLAVSDFSSGAMENWGLITFRDHILLWNPNRSSTAAKELTATVVIHELAHQWFGNLVTMAWWNDLWLNEGFASFIEYFGTSKVFENWKLMDRFYSDNIIVALYLDGLNESHPISSEVDDPNEIGSIFDAISYQKGASVIKMIMDIDGEEPFRKGLTEYLNKYKYGNAKGEDLWNILDKHITTEWGGSLPEIAKKWTHQVGYPVVSVAMAPDKRSMEVSQKRFLYSEKDRNAQTDDMVWPIPLSCRTSRNPNYTKIWLTNATKYKIEFEQTVAWAKLNSGGGGFYRVIYELDIYHQLINLLNSNPTALSSADRGSLIYDAFSFAKAGMVPVTIPLNMVEYIKNGDEGEYLPLTLAFSQLEAIGSLIWDTGFLPKLIKFQRELIAPVYERFGWESPEGHVEKLIQEEMLSTACKLEIPDCVEHSKTLFELWIADENFPLSPDLKSVIIDTGVKNGNASVWDTVYKRYQDTVSPSDQSLYLKALAETKDPWLLNRYLEMILDTHKVKPNLISRVIGDIARNSVGKLMAWRFLKEKWDSIIDLVGLTSMLGNILKAVVEEFSTEFDHQEVKSFFGDKNLGKNRKKLEQSLETIQLHIQWRRLNEAKLEQWLGQRAK